MGCFATALFSSSSSLLEIPQTEEEDEDEEDDAAASGVFQTRAKVPFARGSGK
jgi:hypothetical protein